METKVVNGVTGYEYSWGKCFYCGFDVNMSRYWKGLGPIGMWFVPGENIPVCGPVCSNKNYRKQGKVTPVND